MIVVDIRYHARENTEYELGVFEFVECFNIEEVFEKFLIVLGEFHGSFDEYFANWVVMNHGWKKATKKADCILMLKNGWYYQVGIPGVTK